MQKSIAISIATIAALIVIPAVAADVTPPVAPVVVPIPYTWTGLYGGLNVGGQWGRNAGIDNIATSLFCIGAVGCPLGAAAAAAVPGNIPDHPLGFIGGGQVGYNFQNGQFVYGFETDLEGSADTSAHYAFATAPAVGTINTVSILGNGSQKLDFLGTVRGRVGWTPISTWLLYATAGLAFSRTETTVSFNEQVGGTCFCGPFPTALGSSDAWRAGWAVGGGWEWMASSRWSIKGEYLYYDLGTTTVNTSFLQLNGAAAPLFVVGIPSEAHYRGNLARAGVNYRF